jgi:hypothetical protein
MLSEVFNGLTDSLSDTRVLFRTLPMVRDEVGASRVRVDEFGASNPQSPWRDAGDSEGVN